MEKDKFIEEYMYLHKQGEKEGKIVLFDEEFCDRLDNVFFLGIPLSIHIKYLGPKSLHYDGVGKCFDRSLFMFIANPDSEYVIAECESFEILNGKENNKHAWVELNGYVYDPTDVMRYDKDLFYKMNKPRKVEKYTIEDAPLESRKFYEIVRQTKLEDYLPGGIRQHEFLLSMPFIKEFAENSADENFRIDLNNYLQRLQRCQTRMRNNSEKNIEKTIAKR